MTALPSIPTKASPLAHSREELGGQGKETPSPTQFSDLLVESPQPKENPSDNLAEEPAPPQKNDEPSDPQPQPNQTDLAMFFSLIAPPPAPIPLADSLPEEFDLTLETPSAPQSETNPQCLSPPPLTSSLPSPAISREPTSSTPKYPPSPSNQPPPPPPPPPLPPLPHPFPQTKRSLPRHLHPPLPMHPPQWI